MKLYDYPPAPSPQRINMFISEKGINIPKEQIDLMTGEQLSDEYRRVNPRCTVPALVLDDGTVLSEVEAIYRYLEITFPEPPLMGTSPLEQALVTEWDHRLEMELLTAIAEVFRNGSKAFSNRALPGPLDLEQIPALIDRGKIRIHAFLKILEDQLSKQAYITGENFTAADITAYVCIGFCSWVKIAIPDSHPHLQAWYDKVGQRPSAQALG